MYKSIKANICVENITPDDAIKILKEVKQYREDIRLKHLDYCKVYNAKEETKRLRKEYNKNYYLQKKLEKQKNLRKREFESLGIFYNFF